MAKKKNHYIPAAYLEGWRLGNKKLFFYKNKNIDLGEERKPESIMYQPYLYSVGYCEAIIMGKCAKIKADFLNQTKSILDEQKVYAVFQEQRIIFDNKTFFDLFLKLEDWVFYYESDKRMASKKKIIGKIKRIKSYVIEDELCKRYETQWQNNYDNFIIDIEKKFCEKLGWVKVERQNIDRIIDFLVIQMCRNPEFDSFKFHSKTKFDDMFVLENMLGLDKTDAEQRRFIANQSRCVQLYKLYENLFGVSKEDIKHKSNFEILTGVLKSENFQFVIYSANGSSFITSDNCVVINNCMAMKKNLNMILFPLSYRYLLTIIKPVRTHVVEDILCKGLSTSQVKEINQIIYNNAYKSVVSSEKTLAANIF